MADEKKYLSTFKYKNDDQLYWFKDSDLPRVTPLDNGKFLQVVGGKWALVDGAVDIFNLKDDITGNLYSLGVADGVLYLMDVTDESVQANTEIKFVDSITNTNYKLVVESGLLKLYKL